jgi:hypothetical protein
VRFERSLVVLLEQSAPECFCRWQLRLSPCRSNGRCRLLSRRGRP